MGGQAGLLLALTDGAGDLCPPLADTEGVPKPAARRRLLGGCDVGERKRRHLPEEHRDAEHGGHC